ncbi:MAG TPA: LuxR C-terminal-related transcriptional regulator [Nocardioidaceae bacterium]|nr:LuxR C-terminal-related transcriptional regulator [Nocardioidaceae bacterium]
MTATHRQLRPTGTLTAGEMLAEVRFGIPATSRSQVSRRRLLDTLSATDEVPLVLVSGPAGSGKTTLVSEWVRRSPDTNTGWVTFEDGETAFWAHVLESLRRLGLGVPLVRGGESDDLLAGRKNVLATAAVLVESNVRWTLVLDGYELTSLPLAREIDLLLRHTAGHLRLVLVGRVDPVLPLYRYRLTGDLAEVRCADLAFTDVEAARLLSRLGVTLPADSVHELNRLVRGWAAGLVFAARALALAPSPEKAVGTVLEQTGDIDEYLVGEVLDVQSREMREFLLATSVTDVVVPGLVEELLGAQAVPLLSAAARANVFIEPVPHEAGAYRYYPFFRDLLRVRLAYEAPESAKQLHRRAARWFRNQGAVEQWVQHLVRVGGWEDLCQQLVDDRLVGRLLLEGSTGVLRRSVEDLPGDVTSAEACLVRAATALSAGDRAGCMKELGRARNCASAHDEGAAPFQTALVDALRACGSDEAATADALTEKAERSLLAGLGAGAPGTAGSSAELRALVRFARGVALLRSGRLGDACDALSQAASAGAVESYPYFRARCLGYLAVAQVLQGELSEASRAAAQALVAAAGGGPAVGGAVEKAHVAMAQVAVEQHDAATARQHLAYVDAPALLPPDPVYCALVAGVRAGVEQMGGDTETAAARLRTAAEDLSPGDPWLSELLRASAARIAVATGRPRLALDDLEALADLGPCTVVVAAAAHAELRDDDAVSALLATGPDAEVPLHARIARLLVEALQADRSSSTLRARALLDQALRLAAPEGLRRPFRESGPALERLLTDNADLLLQHRWLTDPTALGAEAAPPRHVVASQAPLGEPQAVLVETLTPKELEVLGHLEELLTTEEIAAQMFVSVNTVRTHVRSVLRKLGVNRRNAAVRRARELGLVSA